MAAGVERWGVFELEFVGPGGGNPFIEVELSATFSQANRAVEVAGFYDGEGRYRVRFMPDAEGVWRYRTRSNRSELDGKTGEFVCVGPSPGNHGPVHVENRFHFAYADGTPYRQLGTTCYAWIHQGDALEEQTLATLARAPFNKLRMCVFPKDYDFNHNDPELYPYVAKTPPAGTRYAWDFTRFDPAFWRHLEKRVQQLGALGIEADIIVFHPYDRWGFSSMPREADDLYMKYLIARLSAYRNVWWSMANEFDIMRSKTMADWDHFFRTFQTFDPYGHLRSVHNCVQFYDHSRPWVSHCSVQSSDLHRVPEWRAAYGKPVVVDECCYEGNICHAWGNITAQELVRRFWRGTVGGGYVGHGETYADPQDLLWWSKGGRLRGESPARLAFLKKILDEVPLAGLEPCHGVVTTGGEGLARCGDEYFLGYFGVHQPSSIRLALPPGRRYTIEAIDTWNMNVETVSRGAAGALEVGFPGRPYMAVRIRAEA